MDALHLIPLTLNAIHGAKGVYVVGVKSNQAHLYRYCSCKSLSSKATYKRPDAPKRGHGRIDQREYACFTVSGSSLATRWQDAGISTLVQVKRIRHDLAGSPLSDEVSYFLSNIRPASQSQADDLFDAIRQHWRIEVMHYQRDMTLSEDALRTSNAAVSRLMSR
ncbi:ISAs1 family transposase [Spirosoma areae]